MNATILGGVILGLAVGPAFCASVTWTLSNATFNDGGSASGYFVLDADTGAVSNWNIVTTAGSVLSGFTYTPGSSTVVAKPNGGGSCTATCVYFSSDMTFPAGALQEFRYLDLAFLGALTDSGGKVNINLSASNECLNCNPYRLFTQGFVQASAANPAPAISPGGIAPVYSTGNSIQPGEWVSIYGNNLAASTTSWNGNFPTSLAGTSVTIDGKAAYLSYVSPTQINLQAPDDSAIGPVAVLVTTAGGSATSTVRLAQAAPSFLLLDSKHVAGIILRTDGSGAYGGGAYDIVGPGGSSLGYATVPAKPGDVVELFGTGFGPTTPAVPAGEAFSGAAASTNPVNVVISNVNLVPSFAGLSGAGLDQISLTIPAGLGSGDVPLVAAVGGAKTAAGVVISLQNGSAAPCVNLSGHWVSVASGTVTETLTAMGSTASSTNPITGAGVSAIQQNGCSLQLTPAPLSGVLTAQQAATVERTGTVSGAAVAVQGPLTLPQLTEPGYTITQVSTNQIQGSGQLSGNSLVLNETGSFQGSGTASVNGQTGTFSVTYSVSAAESLTPQLMANAGTITTIAGDGVAGFSGDGGPATSAEIDNPLGLAVDASGDVFFNDAANARIRKVSPGGIVTTVAGNGTPGFSGDGGPAAAASISSVGLAVDGPGDLFIADGGNNRIRKVSPGGIITTVAGNGTAGFSGDGGPATAAALDDPTSVAVDQSGNLFIEDAGNGRIRKVSSTGMITTLAGNGGTGYTPDGTPAVSATLNLQYGRGIAVDPSGNVLFGDIYDGLVREVTSTGILITVAGCFYQVQPSYVNGAPAIASGQLQPYGIAVDAAGDLFIAEWQVAAYEAPTGILEVPANGSGIVTVAGNGTGDFSGGGPATEVGFLPWGGVAVDAARNLYIADSDHERILKVTPATVYTDALCAESGTCLQGGVAAMKRQ